MLILFLGLWAVLFGLAFFAIAATPTTVSKSGMLGGPFIVTGILSGAVTLMVSGAISTLFS